MCKIVVVVVVSVVTVVIGLVGLTYEQSNTREKRQRLGGSLDRTAELQCHNVTIN